jgi:hypothetical protein
MTDTRERMVREVLSEEVRDAFAPGFADRAAARWKAERKAALAPTLARQFKYVLPLAIAASAVFVFLSVHYRDTTSGQTVAQAVVGQRPQGAAPSVASRETTTATTVDAMYDFGPTVGQ